MGRRIHATLTSLVTCPAYNATQIAAPMFISLTSNSTTTRSAVAAN